MAQDATGLLEPFRKYLKVLAELHLDRKLRGNLDPSDVVQQTMLRAYSALAELRDTRPELMREVVVLKHCQGWTLPQIAERIGRSVPSVAALLRRGLEELRKRLKTGE
jgi:DNA-directed RNA polymerase specialized sigma24 family protein